MLKTPAKTHLVTLTAAALIAVLMAGCEGIMPRTTAPPPTGEVDSACISQCDLKKSQCEERQLLREQDCQQYQSQFKASGRACETRYGSYCVQPVGCLGADVSICETELRECALDCRPIATPQPTPTSEQEDPMTDPGADARPREPS
ncbi:hypothetical protein [Thiocystis violacea]|uniref:hypothetical protein n=1 Tax=Thiocystis violacea TaxID=13725 RepID=UPI001904764D|nr:hypothetical protein [Thiocystis violacea]MBK1720867.1 hypothetical protein [Thiocystis violacea]